jgi:hypothetical protein
MTRWRDEARQWYDARKDELELFDFKKTLNLEVLTNATTEEEKEEAQRTLDDTNERLRQINVDIGYEKRNLDQW